MGAIVIRTRHSSQLRLIPYLHHIEEAKRTHPRFADWRTRYDEGTESAEVATSGYDISALIRCNFIIKNYVNRKIPSYIYLLIFTKSLWIHVKHFIALTERESVRKNFFCDYWSGLSLSTHRPVTTKNTGKYDSIGDNKEKSICTHKIS